MKSVRDFLIGKVRRSETGEHLTVDIDGAADSDFGRLEGCLASAVDAVSFFEDGLRSAGGAGVRYDAINQVAIAPRSGAGRPVEVVRADGTVIRLDCSDDGAMVAHATLRWIGNALLKRRIAD